jgi:hypothetical protein
MHDKFKAILLSCLCLTVLMSAFLFKPSAILAQEATSGSNLLEIENVEVPLGDKMILKDGTPVKEVFNSTDDMVNLIVKVVFLGAGIILFLMIVIAGFSMIGSDGKDKDKAKTTMTSAVIGFYCDVCCLLDHADYSALIGINMGF